MTSRTRSRPIERIEREHLRARARYLARQQIRLQKIPQFKPGSLKPNPLFNMQHKRIQKIQAELSAAI